MPPASEPTHKSRPARPWWVRLLAAPEFGLVIVIAVMVVGLAVYTHIQSGPISQRDFIELPAGSVLIESPDGSTFTIEHDGKRRTYSADEGYSARIAGDKVILIHERHVNKFLNKHNILSVLTSASFIGVMAVGMAGIIVMGGIDLSVGSIYALAAICGAIALHALNQGASVPVPAIIAVPVGVLVCVAVGAACGFVNGSATVGLAVHPFIITLGGMAIYRGIAFVTTQGQAVSEFPDSYVRGFFKAEIFGVTPVPMLIMFLVGIGGMVIFSRTVFGRRVFAVGGNETAARYAGVPVGAVKIAMFTLSGALAGLSAAMYLGYYGAGTSDAAKGYELTVIAAAVVGGVSLSGGRGSAIGAVLGAIIIQLIDNSIIMIGIDQAYKEIVIGMAIVLAVVVDQAKQRLTARR